MDHSISIRGVSKSFRTTRAVRDLDLDVPRGSLCGFLGPNGAGKSTTIRMIMSIIYPDTGTISVLGGSALANKDRIGYLPEERGLYRKMRVGELLEYISRLKGFRPRHLRQHILDWLKRIELPDVYHKRCQELSKGMQQKIQVLASIIHDPELIILDEPFSGLDPVNAVLLNQLIKDLHQQGKTIIFSTHILHQAEQICDRIFLINHGIKLLDATLDEIRHRFDPRTIEVQTNSTPVDFRGIQGVRDTHQVKEDHTYELSLDDQTNPQQVIRHIVEKFDVHSIRLRQVTLEEVFVRLVMQDEGALAAEQVREELSHA